MKQLTCKNCKLVHDWDYDRSYKALVESKLPRREIKCTCGNVMTTIKINKSIPETSVVSEVNRESSKRQMEIIEKRLKGPQIICTNCDKQSGWYKERENESLELGHKKNLVCGHCGHIVLIIEGGVPEKLKQINRPKVDKGYAGRIRKNDKPIRKRREPVEKTPLIKWD